VENKSGIWLSNREKSQKKLDESGSFISIQRSVLMMNISRFNPRLSVSKRWPGQSGEGQVSVWWVTRSDDAANECRLTVDVRPSTDERLIDGRS